jgi:hypothetical protein
MMHTGKGRGRGVSDVPLKDFVNSFVNEAIKRHLIFDNHIKTPIQNLRINLDDKGPGAGMVE